MGSAAPNEERQPPAPGSRPGVSDPAVKHPMSEVKPDAVFNVPGVPDWLVITKDAVWVSNKPKGTVSRMDSRTNQVTATVEVGKQPCSGITAGFGSIWAPLCGDKALARIDAKTNRLLTTLPYGPANSEGGLAASKNAIWYPTDKGTLLRIDPKKNTVVAEIPLPPGSNAAEVAADGSVWVTSTEKAYSSGWTRKPTKSSRRFPSATSRASCAPAPAPSGPTIREKEPSPESISPPTK